MFENSLKMLRLYYLNHQYIYLFLLQLMHIKMILSRLYLILIFFVREFEHLIRRIIFLILALIFRNMVRNSFLINYLINLKNSRWILVKDNNFLLKKIRIIEIIIGLNLMYNLKLIDYFLQRLIHHLIILLRIQPKNYNFVSLP